VVESLHTYIVIVVLVFFVLVVVRRYPKLLQ
jgi:hypothetical protein